MKPRKTLDQLAANGNPDPWACRICGCRDFRVPNSHQRAEGRVRQRVCRHCGEPMRTVEVPCEEGATVRIVREDDEERDMAA